MLFQHTRNKNNSGLEIWSPHNLWPVEVYSVFGPPKVCVHIYLRESDRRRRSDARCREDDETREMPSGGNKPLVILRSMRERRRLTTSHCCDRANNAREPLFRRISRCPWWRTHESKAEWMKFKTHTLRSHHVERITLRIQFKGFWSAWWIQ